MATIKIQVKFELESDYKGKLILEKMIEDLIIKSLRATNVVVKIN